MIRSILLIQVSQIVGRALYLGFSLWFLNRELGVEAKGVWSGLFHLLGIGSILSNMGFEVWLTRSVAGRRIGRQAALRLLFVTKAPLWLLTLIGGTYYVLAGGQDPWVALPFAVALVFDGVAVSQQAVFEGASRATWLALMSFIKSGGFVLLALLGTLWITEPSLAYFGWAFAMAIVIRVIVGWHSWSVLPTEPRALPTGAWRECVLMGAYTLASVLYFRIDSVMLLPMAGDKATGDYGNAYELVEGCLFISAAVAMVLYPRLVQSEGKLRGRLFDLSCHMLLAIGAAGTAGFLVLGEWFGRLLAGPAFAGAVAPLHVLAWGLPFMFANGLLSRWLFAQHRESFALKTAMVAAFLNILGNAILIPQFGAYGAAWMTVITEGLLFFWWLMRGRGSSRLLRYWLVSLLPPLGLWLLLPRFSWSSWLLVPVLLGLALVALFCARDLQRLAVSGESRPP